MEFNFNIESTLKNISKEGVAFLSGEDHNKFTYEEINNIYYLLDKIGELSAIVIIFLYKFIQFSPKDYHQR